jgi:hypothetical protein
MVGVSVGEPHKIVTPHVEDTGASLSPLTNELLSCTVPLPAGHPGSSTLTQYFISPHWFTCKVPIVQSMDFPDCAKVEPVGAETTPPKLK